MVIDVEIENFIGMWTRTWEADGDVQVGTAKYIYVWRFYDDYSGYLTIDDYDKNGKYAGLTRSPFTYKVEQNKLFIYYAGDKEAIEWDYYFEGDTLHVARETDEYGEIEHVFYRGVDADDTLMGEWVYTTTVNGKRVDKRFAYTHQQMQVKMRYDTTRQVTESKMLHIRESTNIPSTTVNYT